MKIEVDILRTRDGNIVWADDNPSGHGFLVHAAGSDVPDEWLEKNGLVEADKPAPKASAKQVPAAANKAVKGPSADK
jgi:hypothetical protein